MANGNGREGVAEVQFLAVATVATSALILALPIYYVRRLVVSLRHRSIPRWPPLICLALWLAQWPFLLLSAVGCLGGGCDDPLRSWLELIVTLGYNVAPGCWLWCRYGDCPRQPET